MNVDEKLRQMKIEIAAEFGIENYDGIDKGNLTSRQNGQIGGEMVKRLVELGKQSLVNEPTKELVPIMVDRKQEQNKVIALSLEGFYNDYSYFPKEYLQ